LVPEKEKQKESLSPASYNNLDSFKKGTLPKERFYINKGKIDNFIVQTQKNKAWIQGPGKYDHDRGTHLITKGAAKGWK
jgi:hypothetical protein